MNFQPSPATSSNTSPLSSDPEPTAYVPAPSVGSSVWHGGSSKTSSTYSGDSLPEYISPYPPLLPTTAAPAGRPIAAITSTQVSQTNAPRSSSAGASSLFAASHDNVRDYPAPAWKRPRSRYRLSHYMFDARLITQAQKQAMITALNEHRINTIVELRRVERIFATLGSSDVTQPMTAAWMYYVNSNSLLTELRGLTKHYPFSSECLEESKRRVHQDPASNRSWNYCWLVLAKIHTDKLITAHAKAQASRPEMWGGRIPSAQSVDQLAKAFVEEWSAALTQLLRYWESAPIR